MRTRAGEEIRLPLVFRAAGLVLVLTLPPVWAVRALKDSDLAWAESSLWTVGAVFAIFVAPLLSGFYAGRREARTPYSHATLGVVLATLVILAIATIRLLVNDKPVPWLTFGLYAQVTVSLAIVGAYIGGRRKSLAAASAS